MRPQTHQSNARAGAFSLLEMIVVVAIIILLFLLVAPVTSQALQASRLSTSAANLANELNGARMLAIRLNQPVEVHFLSYSDRQSPGSGVAYRACQMWVNGRPNAAVTRLETGVILSTMKSGGEPWSSILDAQANARGGDQALPAGFDIPSATTLTGARHAFFQFRPDGSTNLPGNQQWTVTVIPEKDASRTELPPNFSSIVIDPLNGRLRTLSP